MDPLRTSLQSTTCSPSLCHLPQRRHLTRKSLPSTRCRRLRTPSGQSRNFPGALSRWPLALLSSAPGYYCLVWLVPFECRCLAEANALSIARETPCVLPAKRKARSIHRSPCCLRRAIGVVLGRSASRTGSAVRRGAWYRDRYCGEERLVCLLIG